jgi:hypothetical protein
MIVMKKLFMMLFAAAFVFAFAPLLIVTSSSRRQSCRQCKALLYHLNGLQQVPKRMRKNPVLLQEKGWQIR